MRATDLGQPVGWGGHMQGGRTIQHRENESHSMSHSHELAASIYDQEPRHNHPRSSSAITRGSWRGKVGQRDPRARTGAQHRPTLA